jgi:hypothetical protein
MPSIIPGYLYSIFASLIVGALIVVSCSAAMTHIRNEAVTQQLTNIDKYVAAQSLMLIAHTTQNGQNSTQAIQIPSQIGNERFWIRLTNDTSGGWVTSGFGVNINQNGSHVSIPAAVAASGTFVSGSGRPILSCYLQDNVINLVLTQV